MKTRNSSEAYKKLRAPKKILRPKKKRGHKEVRFNDVISYDARPHRPRLGALPGPSILKKSKSTTKIIIKQHQKQTLNTRKQVTNEPGPTVTRNLRPRRQGKK